MTATRFSIKGEAPTGCSAWNRAKVLRLPRLEPGGTSGEIEGTAGQSLHRSLGARPAAPSHRTPFAHKWVYPCRSCMREVVMKEPGLDGRHRDKPAENRRYSAEAK